MPASWEIRPEAGLVRIRLYGPTNLASSIDMMVQVAGSPDFSPDLRVIVDLREMDYQPELREVLELGETLNVMRSLIGNRVAVLTTTAVHQGVTQVMSGLANAAGLKPRFFCDADTAERWLWSEEG